MKRSNIFSAGLAMLAAAPAFAQRALPRGPQGRDTIRGAVVEVYQTYQPEIKLAPRPQPVPALPPVDTARPRFEYSVPQQTLNYTYRALPLQPLALGRDTAPLPPQNYVRAGAGVRRTTLLEAGLVAPSGSGVDGTLQVRHFAQRGSLAFQRASLNDAQAIGTFGVAAHQLGISASALHNRWGYYGRDDARVSGESPERVAFTGLRAEVRLTPDSVGPARILYAPLLGFSFFADGRGSIERGVHAAAPVQYALDESWTIGLALRANLVTLHRDDLTREANNVFAVSPSVAYRDADADVFAALSPTWSRGGTAYLLPTLRGGYNVLANDRLRIEGGWEAEIIQNTYAQLSTRNPFVDRRFAVRQTRTDEVYARARFGLGQHFSASAKGSWWRWSNLPIFLNGFDNTTFNVVHDPRVQALSLETSMRYAVGRTFSTGATATYYSFYRKTFSRLWHEPAVRLQADLRAEPVESITLTAYTTSLARIYAINPEGIPVRLPTIFDIGLGGEYRFSKMLGAFVRADNLLNQRYERWRGYPSVGFAVYGGLSARF